jgi:hypothetical protein
MRRISDGGQVAGQGWREGNVEPVGKAAVLCYGEEDFVCEAVGDCCGGNREERLG